MVLDGNEPCKRMVLVMKQIKFKVGDIISLYEQYKRKHIPILYLVIGIDNNHYQMMIISSPQASDINDILWSNIENIDYLPSLNEAAYV